MNIYELKMKQFSPFMLVSMENFFVNNASYLTNHIINTDKLFLILIAAKTLAVVWSFTVCQCFGDPALQEHTK